MNQVRLKGQRGAAPPLSIVFWNAGRLTVHRVNEFYTSVSLLPASVDIIALNEVFSPDFPTSLPDLSRYGFSSSIHSPPHYRHAAREPSGGAAFYFRARVRWLPRVDVTGDCPHTVFIQCDIPTVTGHSTPIIIGSIYRHATDNEQQHATIHPAMSRALTAIALARPVAPPGDGRRGGEDAAIPLTTACNNRASAAATSATAALSAMQSLLRRANEHDDNLRTCTANLCDVRLLPPTPVNQLAAANLAKGVRIMEMIAPVFRREANDAVDHYRHCSRLRDKAIAEAERISELSRSPIPVLFVGDFNARAIDFGDSKSNPAGTTLSAFCDSHQLTVLNHLSASGTPTHGESVLDLAITNSPHLFHDLIVNPHSIHFSSDHLPLALIFAAHAPTARAAHRSSAIRWQLQRTDWAAFRAACERVDAATLARTSTAFTRHVPAAARHGFYSPGGAGYGSAVTFIDGHCAAAAAAVAVAAARLVERNDRASADDYDRCQTLLSDRRSEALAMLPPCLPAAPPPLSESLPIVEEMWNEIRSALLAAAHSAVPVAPTHARSPVFRQSPTLLPLLRELRRTRNLYHRHRRSDRVTREDVERRAAAEAARHAFADEFHAAKKKAFNAMCDGVGDQCVDWRRMPLSRSRGSDGAIFTVAAGSDAPDPTVLSRLSDAPRDCSTLSTEARALNIIAAHFAANGTLVLDDRDRRLLEPCGDGDNCPPVGPHRLCNDDITLKEVCEVIDRLPSRGAPGTDSIPNLFIRHSSDKLRRAQHKLSQATFALSVLPREWRSANVCALHKGHGAPAADVKSYRPIALTPCSCKLNERVMLARLRQIIGARIHSAQFGFRQSMCTADALHRVRSAIIERLRNETQSHVTVAFLDISKAFDRTWHAAVLHKLWRMGVHGRLWRWIRAFLTDRRIRVIYGGSVSDWFSVNAGVPQGSVISPELFNVFINDLPELERLHHVLFALYADDIALWPVPCPRKPRDDHRDKAIRLTDEDIRLNGAITAIGGWADENRVTFGIDKCGSVRFSSPPAHRNRAKVREMATPDMNVYQLIDSDERNDSDDPSDDIPPLRRAVSYRRAAPDVRIGPVYLRLQGKRLPRCSHYEYLGVILQSNLRWDLQCAKVVKKVRAASSLIIRLIRRDEPPRFACVRQLVSALALPIVAYGAHIWHPFSNNLAFTDKHAARILSALIQPLRIALGLPRTPSFHAVLAESGFADIPTTFQRHTISFIARAAALPATHPTHQLVKSQLSGRVATASPATRVFPLLRSARKGLFAHRAFDRCDIAGFRWLPADFVGASGCARIAAAARQASFRRWQRSVGDGNACRDLVALRAARRPIAHSLARKIDRGVSARGFPLRGMAGMPAFLRVFSKPAAVLCARLRLNRAYIGDSLFRRLFGAESDECQRCNAAAVAVSDSVHHFLYDCPGDNGRHAPLTRIRALPRFAEIFIAAPHDVSLVLGDALPLHTHKENMRYLALLNSLYEAFIAAGFSV